MAFLLAVELNLLTTFAIGFIIFLIWFLINRGNKKEEPQTPPPVIRLPHEIALENLGL